MRNQSPLVLLLLLLLATPQALAEETYIFDHQFHTDEAEVDCATCHVESASGSPERGLMPSGTACIECHDEEILSALPELPSSHMGDHRNNHQFMVRGDGKDCVMCHRESESCTLCHHGENVDFVIHDRDFLYSHPLDAKQGIEDCASCHDTQTFCVDCHMGMGIKPGDHFPTGDWLQPSHHGVAGREDLGSCLNCHGGPEPVCKNCHN